MSGQFKEMMEDKSSDSEKLKSVEEAKEVLNLISEYVFPDEESQHINNVYGHAISKEREDKSQMIADKIMVTCEYLRDFYSNILVTRSRHDKGCEDFFRDKSMYGLMKERGVIVDEDHNKYSAEVICNNLIKSIEKELQDTKCSIHQAMCIFVSRISQIIQLPDRIKENNKNDRNAWMRFL
jgi:hypothetical protein